MDKAEMAAAMKEQLDTFKEGLGDFVSKDDMTNKLEELSVEIEKLDNTELKSSLEELNKAIEIQGLEIAKFNKGEDVKAKTLVEQIEVNKEGIDKAANKTVKEYDFTVKANATRASVSNSTQALRLDDIGQLAHRKLVARDFFQVVPVGAGSNGTIRYADWDEDTKVRAAAMVAEGGTFAESTAAWAEYSITLKKIGDTIPVTEEMIQDAGRFAAELRGFLQTNVDLVEDTQLTTGAGTGNNLKGYYTSATEYVAAAAGISDANIYDLIVKMAESMTSGGGSKYMPNVAFMNIADINKMKLKKDDNNNYVVPPFSTNGGQQVDGITIVETNALTADTMVLADSRFAKIYEVEGYNVSVGYTGDQFVEDLMTLKAKKREALLIRTADAGGFLKETGIAAALVTLASS